MGLSRMREIRTRRGWSLTRLTMATGIDPSHLSLIERGRVPAWPAWRKRIATALEVEEAELFDGAGTVAATA
jgi:transcriptional regulator with XRE-family HTH domain